MIDKIKSLWGSSTLDRDEYQKAIADMRAQEARHRMDAAMMNSTQNAAQQSALGNSYQNAAQQRQGWNDPRGSSLRGAVPISREDVMIDALADTNKVMKRLAERVERQEKRIDMLSGFYTWITEVHPEIAAQHKAMRDLYEAANSNETQGRQA
jgi:hypothetical protein